MNITFGHENLGVGPVSCGDPECEVKHLGVFLLEGDPGLRTGQQIPDTFLGQLIGIFTFIDDDAIDGLVVELMKLKDKKGIN